MLRVVLEDSTPMSVVDDVVDSEDPLDESRGELEVLASVLVGVANDASCLERLAAGSVVWKTLGDDKGAIVVELEVRVLILEASELG